MRPGTRWEHYKGGVYIVLYVATCTETGMERVIYYNETQPMGLIWDRPLEMWHEEVNGTPRFKEA